VGGDIEDIFADSGSLMYQFLRPSAVRPLLAQHRSGQNDNHKMLFSLVVFEEWLRQNRGLVNGSDFQTDQRLASLHK
jgi:asparagine synthase (glutamine-hydrolysing)